MNEIILKPGRDKTARQFHPWIFSGAIAKAKGNIAPGEIVKVLDNAGEFVAYGYFNPNSQISIRLLEWNEDNVIDEAWWREKIKASIIRRGIFEDDNRTNAYRLIFGESDFLPGLIVDKYSDFLVVQILTAGIEKVKSIIVTTLAKLLLPEGIYERSDVETRTLEGLTLSSGVASGSEPPELLEITENGLKFLIDIKGGQKSGGYLDQRDNRLAVAAYANGLEVLDCFAYTGAFSVNALARGARSVTLVDSSAQSLTLAQQNIRLNNLDAGSAETVVGDVFKVLREYRGTGRKFDMVILDPPKFAPTKADLKKALSGYKDINLLAMQLLKPGGILATFSCSGAVDIQTLQTVLFWAGSDIGCELQILKTLSQGEDHPRLVSFPESEYLKGLICRVI
jgi:23S rRNA (cytosine1962-C5)-methyltransferase